MVATAWMASTHNVEQLNMKMLGINWTFNWFILRIVQFFQLEKSNLNKMVFLVERPFCSRRPPSLHSTLARRQTISICVIIFGRQLCFFFFPIRCTRCQMCVCASVSAATICVCAWVPMWSIKMYSAILRSNSINIWVMYLAALHRQLELPEMGISQRY